MAGWLAFVGKLACWLSCFSPPRTDVILDTHIHMCTYILLFPKLPNGSLNQVCSIQKQKTQIADPDAKVQDARRQVSCHEIMTSVMAKGITYVVSENLRGVGDLYIVAIV